MAAITILFLAVMVIAAPVANTANVPTDELHLYSNHIHQSLERAKIALSSFQNRRTTSLDIDDSLTMWTCPDKSISAGAGRDCVEPFTTSERVACGIVAVSLFTTFVCIILIVFSRAPRGVVLEDDSFSDKREEQQILEAKYFD